MASAFTRQLKFSIALVDSFGRLTAQALLDGNFECVENGEADYNA